VPPTIGFELTALMREIERIEPPERIVESDDLALAAECDAPAATNRMTPYNSMVFLASGTTPACADLYSAL